MSEFPRIYQPKALELLLKKLVTDESKIVLE